MQGRYRGDKGAPQLVEGMSDQRGSNTQRKARVHRRTVQCGPETCATTQPRIEAPAQRGRHRRQQPKLGDARTGSRGVMEQPGGAAIGGGHLRHLRRRDQSLQLVHTMRRAEAERVERAVGGERSLVCGFNLPDPLERTRSRASAHS